MFLYKSYTILRRCWTDVVKQKVGLSAPLKCNQIQYFFLHIFTPLSQENNFVVPRSEFPISRYSVLSYLAFLMMCYATNMQHVSQQREKSMENKSWVLQLIQNAAARLVFILPKFSHTTSLLRTLHWLPVAA